jgi:hypothetical protein
MHGKGPYFSEVFLKWLVLITAFATNIWGETRKNQENLYFD